MGAQATKLETAVIKDPLRSKKTLFILADGSVSILISSSLPKYLEICLNTSMANLSKKL